MSYTNATFFLDFEGGSDSARTALTTVTASNPSGTITRLNKTGHGLVTGAVVDLTLFSAWLNEAWKITKVDNDNFDLDGAVWQATADNNGTATPRGGSSKADAWKTSTSGATSARIAAGDTIRVMASPDETSLGQTATWTAASKTVTLTTAVTANITDCETAWTASANVTSTADATTFKENTKSAKHVIAAGFTTGLASFFATGTLDLSGYQQVSFWLRSSLATTTGMLSLRLCSDVAGVTTVNTIAVPAQSNTDVWTAFTVDTGGALGASIKSVALYGDTDPGSNTIYIDNIIACKAASAADSLSLTSLIGKIGNLVWVASSTYAANDIRKPTQTNRNGYRYKVTAGGGGAAGASEPTWPAYVGGTVVDGALTWTCEGLEECWAPIQSINGTTVKLDASNATLGNAGRGYDGATESVTTYKREPIAMTMSNSTTNPYYQPTRSGSITAQISYIGGWNRTDMTTETGETWISGQNGCSYAIGTDSGGWNYITWDNINATRCSTGVDLASSNSFNIYRCKFVGMGYGFRNTGNSWQINMSMGALNYNQNMGLYAPSNIGARLQRTRLSSNTSDGLYIGANLATVALDACELKNNGAYAVEMGGFAYPIVMTNCIMASNATAGISTGSTIATYLTNCLQSDSTLYATLGAQQGRRIYSQKHNQTADNHLITFDQGTIISATDQRNTASGISWKFRPTSTNCTSFYPMVLSVAKIACTANVAVNLNIYTRRNSTNVQGQLCVLGGQLTGVGDDVTVSCAPSINTWTNSSTLTFTPTETGVIEVLFKVWDGVGTTNNFWIDDLTIA